MKLFVFRGFTDDPQGILTAVHRLALVGIELCLNVGFEIRKAGLELGVAAFAYADGRWRGLLYDPQFALRHDCSLAHLVGRA